MYASIKLFSSGHFDQGWCQCLLWEVITGRVKFGFSNGQASDNVVLNNHGEPLATADESQTSGTFVSEFHVTGTGKFTVRV